MIDVSSLKGLTQDSREVKPGYLFAAFKGEKSDGRDYIEQAIEQGATHILTDVSKKQMSSPRKRGSSAEIITVENPRQTFAHLVAEYYNAQPEIITAVTGTNGKTSIVHFTKIIWEALGYKAASLGTLSGKMTTADPVSLHEELQNLAQSGITHLAMEASSHGLDQYRMDGVRINAAGFTNLSHDHLDYHKDMDAYFKAKTRLFTDVMDKDGIAIINADDEYGRRLIAICKDAGRKYLTYGFKGEDLKIEKAEALPQGQNITLKIKNETYRIEFPLVGEFQLLNALCALGLILAQDGIDQGKAIAALETLTGAPGRLQSVPGHLKGAGIYVDYAHTPDALDHVLKALRPHTENKFVCVFGCGGDRDKAKRPEMGEIASRLADRVIVTDDNPRSEDPASIRSAILAAAPSAREIGGRRKAIQTAINDLAKGDVLLIAGKGHEQGQIFADHTDPFDDVTEVQNALKAMKVLKEEK